MNLVSIRDEKHLIFVFNFLGFLVKKNKNSWCILDLIDEYYEVDEDKEERSK